MNNVEHIKIIGIGCNLACYGGIKPDSKNMRELSELVVLLEKKFHIDLEIISGGNLTVSGNVTIGSSVENYSIIYCKNNLNLGSNTTFYGVLIGKGSSSTFNNANLYGASYLESQTVSMSNTSVVGSLVSKYSLVMDGASSITKGNLPDIFGTNIGFNPSVLPGSHLEY